MTEHRKVESEYTDVGPAPAGLTGHPPTEFDSHWVSDIIGFFTGTQTDPWVAAEAAYNLIGFGFSQLRGPRSFGATPSGVNPENMPPPMHAFAHAANLSNQDLCDRLQNYADVKADPSRSAAVQAVPWNLILPLALELVKRLLDRWSQEPPQQAGTFGNR